MQPRLTSIHYLQPVVMLSCLFSPSLVVVVQRQQLPLPFYSRTLVPVWWHLPDPAVAARELDAGS